MNLRSAKMKSIFRSCVIGPMLDVTVHEVTTSREPSRQEIFVVQKPVDGRGGRTLSEP